MQACNNVGDATLVLGEVEDGVRTLVAMDVAVENDVNPMIVQHLLHVPLMLDPSGPDDGRAGLRAEVGFRGPELGNVHALIVFSCV